MTHLDAPESDNCLEAMYRDGIKGDPKKGESRYEEARMALRKTVMLTCHTLWEYFMCVIKTKPLPTKL